MGNEEVFKHPLNFMGTLFPKNLLPSFMLSSSPIPLSRPLSYPFVDFLCIARAKVNTNDFLALAYINLSIADMLNFMEGHEHVFAHSAKMATGQSFDDFTDSLIDLQRMTVFKVKDYFLIAQRTAIDQFIKSNGDVTSLGSHPIKNNMILRERVSERGGTW